MTMEEAYRKYFTEIRKYDPFPMELDYDSVLDFAEWLMSAHPVEDAEG